MDKDRRKQAIKAKVQRLSDSITRARKDQEGLAFISARLVLLLFI